MLGKFRLELTEVAEKEYRRLYEEAEACLKAGDSSNSKVTLFRMVDEALEVIIPHDPFSPDRALAGPLSNIFRVKKGRIRICYIGSSKETRIVVLYISSRPRKEGHASDPYRLFTKLVSSGRLDQFFDLLGVRRPDRGKPAGPASTR